MPSGHGGKRSSSDEREVRGASRLFPWLSQLCGKASVSRGRPTPPKTSFVLCEDADVETRSTLSHPTCDFPGLSAELVGGVWEKGRERCSPAKGG